MRLKIKSLAALTGIFLLTAAALPLNILRAQNNASVTITVSVPAFLKDAFTDQVLGPFESANPGVKVEVVENDTNVPDATQGVAAHLQAMQSFVSTGDVLFISSSDVSVEATRGGYYLDLAPLVSQDKTLNSDDFYPPMWQSFQWDKGIWALPTAANLYVLSYSPAAFDKANVPYPSDKWTLDDLVNAANKLTVKDPGGNVTTPAIATFGGYSLQALFRSLLGTGLYDDSVVPNTAKIDTPATEALLSAWYQLTTNGEVAGGGGGGPGGITAPISISPVTQIYFRNAVAQSDPHVGVLLPGGKGALQVQGFAVSKGTQYPQQAYALAAYLTTQGGTLNRGAAVTARKSLAAAGTGGGFGPGAGANLPDEAKKLLADGAQSGFGASDMRFFNYLSVALRSMSSNNGDAKAALQDAETQADSNLQAADTGKSTVAIVVATPIPTGNVNGKPTLKFGMVSFQRPLPQKDKWDKLASDFAASDPAVGQVLIDLPAGFGNSAEQLASKYDCFYIPTNSVPDVQLNTILDLTPYVGTDKTYDKADFVGNVIDQVTRDNKIWALPIDIEPTILRYDATQFDKAGVPQPINGWTVSGFNDALKALKINPTDNPPFVGTNGGTHLLMLIASFGALPIDFRTNPPTVNFTDPKTVDAIKQVLDLAKNGYIQYSALGNIAGGGFNFGGGIPNADILTQQLNAFFRRALGNAPSD